MGSIVEERVKELKSITWTETPKGIGASIRLPSGFALDVYALMVAQGILTKIAGLESQLESEMVAEVALRCKLKELQTRIEEMERITLPDGNDTAPALNYDDYGAGSDDDDDDGGPPALTSSLFRDATITQPSAQLSVAQLSAQVSTQISAQLRAQSSTQLTTQPSAQSVTQPSAQMTAQPSTQSVAQPCTAESSTPQVTDSDARPKSKAPEISSSKESVNLSVGDSQSQGVTAGDSQLQGGTVGESQSQGVTVGESQPQGVTVGGSQSQGETASPVPIHVVAGEVTGMDALDAQMKCDDCASKSYSEFKDSKKEAKARLKKNRSFFSKKNNENEIKLREEFAKRLNSISLTEIDQKSHINVDKRDELREYVKKNPDVKVHLWM